MPRPLRKRQRDQTREDIEEAAFSLFNERGFDVTTVAQIAANAGVAIRTFYRYFPTKEDAVFGDHEEMVERLRAALKEGNPSDPPLRRVQQAILAVQAPGAHVEREITRARLIAEVPSVRARFHQLAEKFEDVVAETLADEMGSGEDALARALIVTGIVFGALRGARRAAATLPHPDPLWLVQTAFSIVEDGVAAQLAPHDTRSRD